jgi:hypothetical protein
MRRRTPLLALCSLVALLVVPAAAHEATQATPPDRNDPCVVGSKDACGTTGVGYYRVGKYGQRWYGDFRNAIAGVAHAYCIDLRFWYPSAKYAYRENTGASLVSKAGRTVPVESVRRISYAIARFGQTNNPAQAAAVMLYVHSQIGDARPGELDPATAGPGVAALYKRVAADSAAFHGPYRIDLRPSGSLMVGKAATATVRVLSASGKPLTGIKLAITGDGAHAVKAREAGEFSVSFTPATTSPHLTVRAIGLPSTLPRVFVPTTAAAAPNGQRLIAADSQDVAAVIRTAASKRQLAATSTASPSVLAAGETTTDRVTITGAVAGWHATVQAFVYGPFRSLAQANCTGTPAWSGTFTTNGPGTYTTPAATLTVAGWYSFVEVIPSDAVHVGLKTACGLASESFKVQAAPQVSTVVSAQRVTLSSPISDRIHVQGLAGQSVTIKASLYGPFADASKITCSGAPVWTGTVAAATDGDYVTAGFTPTLPGYYTYREEIVASDLVRPVLTPCGDVAETTVAVAHPAVTTRISQQQANVGASISDQLTVSGLGSIAASVRVELWGPFASAAAVTCTGTPFAVQTVGIAGDGTYSTPPVTLTRAGTYSYRASIAAGPLNDAFTAQCGESVESVVVTAPAPPSKPPPSKTPKPKPPAFKPTRVSLSTVASDEVVRPGAAIYDRIRTKGVRGRVKVELFGPFATRGGMRCTGRPVWTGVVSVQADGEIPSPSAIVHKAGFYGFRERVLGPNGRAKLVTACAVEAETSLAAPLVVTGRGDTPKYVPAPGVGGATPTRVIVPDAGIDGSIAPVGIDVDGGVLGVPSSIHRAGWWRDGAAPGSKAGSLLIAGHVDSAKQGTGVFFKLRTLRKGARIVVATAGGRRVAYRVVGIAIYPKAALPTRVWSRRGAARLVLVTCGGRFDKKTGHYLDNVVVTAAPA